MISSRMALTWLLFIDLTSHTLEEKWTPVAYLHAYEPLVVGMRVTIRGIGGRHMSCVW